MTDGQDNEPQIELAGASAYPNDYVDPVTEKVVTNGEVRVMAMETAELKPEGWNALDDNEREAWIEGVIRDNDLGIHDPVVDEPEDDPVVDEPESGPRVGADWDRFFDENDDEIDAIDLTDLNASDIEALLEKRVDDDKILAMSAALGEATTDIRTARLRVMRTLNILEQIGTVGIRLVPLFI